MNQTLKGALVKFVNENQDDWDMNQIRGRIKSAVTSITVALICVTMTSRALSRDEHVTRHFLCQKLDKNVFS